MRVTRTSGLCRFRVDAMLAVQYRFAANEGFAMSPLDCYVGLCRTIVPCSASALQRHAMLFGCPKQSYFAH
jgi:hypothetical protein